MYKEDIVNEIAKKTGFTKTDTSTFVDEFLSVLRQNLIKGEKVTFVGFGTFNVIDTKEKMGRNPQTGKSIKIPASKRVKFSAGKTLKEEVKAGKTTKKGKK